MFNGFTAQDLDLPTGRIHYRMGGAGDAVLLLHGFPQTHAMWGYIAPLLAQGYRVICPDLAGLWRLAQACGCGAIIRFGKWRGIRLH